MKNKWTYNDTWRRRQLGRRRRRLDGEPLLPAPVCCLLRSSPILPSLFSSSIPSTRLNFSHLPSRRYATSLSPGTLSTDFTWDDVLRLNHAHLQASTDLRGFFDKVSLCNRNADNIREFVPFVVEGEIVGYVHDGFAHHLQRYNDVFAFPKEAAYGSSFGYYVALHPALRSPSDRTEAVGKIVKCLGEELIPGTRNELYPVVSSFGKPEFFSLERAAAPYFGIKAYGVHMNGYVERDNQKYLWVGKRSREKQTYPGKLDHLVAGGQPHGISCEENLVKECKEEAGIPRSISSKATAAGAISYSDIDGCRFKRDVLFCYDLKLPEDFTPLNEDGEVESFKLVPVRHVANIIRNTDFFKPNCTLVIMDFLFRHGFITPDELGYLDLLQSLRRGDCS